MPDWFYRTVSQPVLFKLPPATARACALGFMGRLARLPCGVGRGLIELLGHMHPDRRLQCKLGEHTVQSPVGLGCGLDPAGQALSAWQQFGFGYIEVGPVATRAANVADGVERDIKTATIVLPVECTFSAAKVKERIGAASVPGCKVMIRLRPQPGQSVCAVLSELTALIGNLNTVTDVFAIDVGDYWGAWTAKDWQRIRDGLLANAEWTCVLCVPVNRPLHPHLHVLTETSSIPQVRLLIDGELRAASNRQLGRPAFKKSLAMLQQLRQQFGERPTILVAGGVHQPADARTLLAAGANFIQIDTGLIYSGPGLCKRIHAAMLQLLAPRGIRCQDSVFRRTHTPTKEPACAVPGTDAHAPGAQPEPGRAADVSPVRQSWFWTGCMGVAMLLGSLIALWISATDVVFPYDLEFCGLTVEQLRAINPNLLPFMAHDRVTLAGSMIALGIMYVGLSFNASRQGQSWAKTAILSSAGVGFFSFFLFLGFDYFDPFHGFVTAVLFQLFALGLYAKLPGKRLDGAVDWVETPAWRWAQWGQFLLVIHSVGLLLAGGIISFIGVQDVLIATDLDFLNTDLATLRDAGSNILPLVAHDRATLGGMLIAAGIVYLLTVLWGLGPGKPWLWHTLWWSALAAYTATIGVHFAVGYIDVLHLLPAFLGLGMMTVGQLLLRSWMHAK